MLEHLDGRDEIELLLDLRRQDIEPAEGDVSQAACELAGPVQPRLRKVPIGKVELNVRKFLRDCDFRHSSADADHENASRLAEPYRFSQVEIAKISARRVQEHVDNCHGKGRKRRWRLRKALLSA